MMGKEMVEPISLATAISLLAKSAPTWLNTLYDTFLDKGKEFAFEQGKKRLHEYSDKKKQLRHLELILKNAAERGLTKFHTIQERDLYRDILTILSEPGPHSDSLRCEAMRLFTLSESPNLEELKEVYNRSLRFRSLTQSKPPDEVDTTAYLNSFFEALITELYMDALFHERMSDVLKVRSETSMQRSLTEVVATLHQIGGVLIPTFTIEQFEEDVQAYTLYLERTLRHHKLFSIIRQDHENENLDPELNDIFVPLHIASQKQVKRNSLISSLEHAPCIVLLGEPGSGKSTSLRHLAWSHAAANLPSGPSINTPLLSGNPLPLRIELRRFVEDRRQRPDYSFLSYTVEVVLGRDNVHIQAQMFHELLERRAMLLLFDGLDEVATLEERQKLIEEIEHLAMDYPGNRFLVTSRPVGYDLAKFSYHLFSRAWIQEFDDTQIRTFLKQWYLNVLRLSPLPFDEQQELEAFYSILKEKPRLHTLATNPLLLTVLTALHRSKHLPDRRVLAYEECAKILLEIWAQYRGTDKRWNDLIMTEEDKHACVAHLGFVLHKRSQAQEDHLGAKRKDRTSDISTDVASAFLLREIEHFLESQNLFSSVAEQRAEAKRFLKLIQIEAGLIVEKGTNEDGEAFYGFVHRTFQEYFAAMHFYEQYQREEDASVISTFLETYLFDPHWHEVILLLLGKLKRKPATTHLIQLLGGKINNRLSNYEDILQQNLFFASLCLTEEISVESHLADRIILQLCHLITSSPFPAQRAEAIEVLASLKSTRQYASIAQHALQALFTQHALDGTTKIQIARVLYENSPANSEEKLQATLMLQQAAESPDVPFQLAIETLQMRYWYSSYESEEPQTLRQMLFRLAWRPSTAFEDALSFCEAELYEETNPEGVEMLLQLARRSDITFEQQIRAARSLHRYTESKSMESQLAMQMLFDLTQHRHLSLEQRLLSAQALYECSFTESKEAELAARTLLELTQNPHISIEQSIEIARTFYKHRSEKAEEKSHVTQMLFKLLQRSDLSIEEVIQVNKALCQTHSLGSNVRQQALQNLSQLSQQPGIPFEQRVMAARTLGECSSMKSDERQQALQTLLTLSQLPDLTAEQTLYIVQTLHQYSSIRTLVEQPIKQVLSDLIQRPNISFDAMVSVLQFLYEDINPVYNNKSDALELAASQEPVVRALAKQIMSQLLQKESLTDDQRLQLIAIPLTASKANYADKAHSVRMILAMMSEEAAKKYLEEHWRTVEHSYHEQDSSDIFYIIELARREILPTGIRDGLYKLLRRAFAWNGEDLYENDPFLPDYPDDIS
jgi:hypothetical protein